MLYAPFRSVLHHARYLPLWSALTALRGRSFEDRSEGLGATLEAVMRWFPPAQRRFDRRSAAGLSADAARCAGPAGPRDGPPDGQTLFETLPRRRVPDAPPPLSRLGPRLGVLKLAQAAGRGAIIVSGHFGQWEAVRAAIKMHGMESGAVYRPAQEPALRTPPARRDRGGGPADLRHRAARDDGAGPALRAGRDRVDPARREIGGRCAAAVPGA